MTDIANQNILFAAHVHAIDIACRQIEGAAHLFDGLSLWDTALERFDLRSSAVRLREAAAKVEDIAERLKGPATAFPDYNAMSEAAE